MRTLAYRGGKPIIQTPIKPRNSLSKDAVLETMKFLERARGHDLSGYLAGSGRGGVAVQKLETMWCETFQCEHAIAVNSATSGIWAALAVLLPDSGTIHIPVMGMSAIAAVPTIQRRFIRFHDVDEHYCLRLAPKDVAVNDVILAVNLFGHPAQLRELRSLADNKKAFFIEDNAQGIYAQEHGVFAGTVGHIGIWSGNVHKPLNCGELGVLTTNDSGLAHELRMFINHGEVVDGLAGLNLRPTELTAVMALAQMAHAREVVEQCQDIHDTLQDLSYDEFFQIAEERDPCTSSWYCLPIEAPTVATRDFAVKALQAEGLPCRAGYVRIDKMSAFQEYVPETEGLFPNADLAQQHMILVELCSLDPTDEQVAQISEALNAVGEEAENERKVRRRDQRQSRAQSRQLPDPDQGGQGAKG